MQSDVISCWCLPCPADSKRFSAVIEALGAAQGAPVFEPHLTLGSLVAPSDLSEIAKRLSGLSLDPVGLDGTEAFTTSLFVRFAPAQGLIEAREHLTRMPGSLAGRTFDPHVSLCYGPPPAGSRSRQDVQALLRSPLRFDRLAAVPVTLPVSTHQQVEAWRISQVWPF